MQHVRDFVGHSTGITCIAKVDDKGRFLSSSKDRVVKLWDSRFNCNDSEDEMNSHRLLLATFDKIDHRRTIRDMTIIDDGAYVRPTDKLDMAMALAMTKKAALEGSGSVQKAAKERQIIGCSCEFATITCRHPVVKVFSVTQIDHEGQSPMEGGNVAEVKLSQELAHDSVVESIASERKKGMILTGGEFRRMCSALNRGCLLL